MIDSGLLKKLLILARVADTIHKTRVPYKINREKDANGGLGYSLPRPLTKQFLLSDRVFRACQWRALTLHLFASATR